MGNTLRAANLLQQQQPEEQNSNQISACIICTDSINSPIQQFKNGNKCSHSICINCIDKYIEYKLDDKDKGVIRCPALDCAESLDPLACQPIISQHVFVRWCDLLCQSAISRYERQYCPYRTCNSLILNECDKSVDKCTCPDCGKDFCFKCGRVWHAGFGCEESISSEDRELGELVENLGWRRCPGCRHVIELVSGCGTMICRCGVVFCYDCGRQRVEGCRCEGYMLYIEIFTYLLPLLVAFGVTFV